ncbi:hypothetical protein PVK06_027518 [Gossypium arboreum]|uniref:Aminotransferase-like plant mobile domain-containing protein n=1 Tax=Gossypium arboreum TaxID=29729 RepID=A0ABR0P0X9_GOSAR|nr:hypothetical protein PVK06_027518 [Gossypium arboreum]
MFVKRWKLETHTFHFPCEERTITLEDIALQLGLPVDWPVVTGSTVIPSKVVLCRAILGKAPHNLTVDRYQSTGWKIILKSFLRTQRSRYKAIRPGIHHEFEWMSYTDTDMISCTYFGSPVSHSLHPYDLELWPDDRAFITIDDDTDTDAHAKVNISVDTGDNSDVLRI